ncbi:hypothetical protein ABIB90_000530 [Bradyrhizobium sp. JR4.1]|uniref:glycine-rich domain-containing protein n=1 Tax=Bradyrhizobium sp. JR4.1 TaxID=3156372 RepID=UPI003397CCE8
MTALSSYSTGTCAVSADGTTVTGTSTIWSSAGNVKPGDLFQSGHFVSKITDVTDDTHLVILPWPGSTLSGATYAIWKESQQRIVGETYARDVDKAVSAWNTSGFFVFVAVGATAPDPSLGDDGQWAFQPTTGAYWLKTGGVWVASGPPAKGYGGTSTTSLVIGTGSKAFTTQSGLAYQNGARVRATSNGDAAKWMEGVATYSGTTLTINVDKTNGTGTFADWNFNVAGQFGAGDVTSSNNLSEYAATAATALGNLAGVSYGAAQTLTAGQKDQASANIGTVRAVRIQTFVVSGTYTPNANMLYCTIECQGGGGSGGSCVAGSGAYTTGSGGGGGAYARKTVSRATVGASQTVTIGAGGAAPAAGANSGAAGGTTSVGALCSASGWHGRRIHTG